MIDSVVHQQINKPKLEMDDEFKRTVLEEIRRLGDEIKQLREVMRDTNTLATSIEETIKTSSESLVSIENVIFDKNEDENTTKIEDRTPSSSSKSRKIYQYALSKLNDGKEEHVGVYYRVEDCCDVLECSPGTVARYLDGKKTKLNGKWKIEKVKIRKSKK